MPNIAFQYIFLLVFPCISILSITKNRNIKSPKVKTCLYIVNPKSFILEVKRIGELRVVKSEKDRHITTPAIKI